MKIIALVGKAGSGKDTLLKAVMKEYPDRFQAIVSCTTRPPREGEVDGVDYYFLTVEEFTKRLLNGDLMEATEFNDWHYGTLYSSLSKDKINIGIFNPEGILTLSDYSGIDLDVWQIEASDKTRLLRQLNREDNPNVDEIIRRYKTDVEDFQTFGLEFGRDPIIYTNEKKEDIATFVELIGQEY